MGLKIPMAWRQNNNANYNTPNTSFTFSEQPSELSAAENNITFELNPITSGTGLKARVELQVTGNIAAGEQFEIEFFLTTIKLTASTTPTVNEFVTSAFSGLTYRRNTAVAIASEIEKSNLVSNYYNVSTNEDIIIIEAKQAGTQFVINYLTRPINTLILFNQVGTSRFHIENPIDYQAFAEVWVVNGDYGTVINKNNNAVLADTLFFNPTDDGKISFNINEIVRDYVDIVLPTKRLDTLPNLTELDKVGETKIMTAYFVVFGDSYRHVLNGDRKMYPQGVSQLRWVQNAAFNKLNPYSLSQYVWDATAIPFSFLTNCPDYKEVSYNSLEFLQFIRKKTNMNGAYGRRLEITFIDGSQQTFTTPIANSYIDLSNNLSMDVSPLNLNIQGIENSASLLVDEYAVSFYYIANTTPIYSQRKRYKMRRKCDEFFENLVFFNSLGGWDTIEMRGENSFTRQSDNNSFARNAPIKTNRATTIPFEQEITVNRIANDTIQLNSALINKEHYKWVAELLTSSAVFIYDYNLLSFRSVKIVNSDYQYDSKGEEFNLRVDIQYTSKINSQSR